jgi:hypothetical protein
MTVKILDEELAEKAAKNACDILGLTFTKIKDHLELIKIYLALSQLMGNNNGLMYHWIHTHNTQLGYKPIEGIEKNKLKDVLSYLEGSLFV